jgi:hypothetical protein
MPKNVGFAEGVVEALREAQILGVRAGAGHRYTRIWVVVVGGRVFARSWNDKPTGWFRAFKKEPEGTIQFGAHEVQVRARFPRGAGVLSAVTQAFARKYDTKGSRKWVEGFADPARERTTVEFVPLKRQ